MRVKLSIFSSVILLICGLAVMGCGKKKEAPIDPHSPKGVMVTLMQQGQLLNDALGRQDFQYIHDYAYYLTGLTQALYSKLDESQKQQLKGELEEINKLGNQLDHSAGRKHVEATTATMQRLQEVLKELNQKFQTMNQAA